MKSRKTLIKVCGMRDPENIGELLKVDIDFLGLIFYPPSPRYVSKPEQIATILAAPRSYKLVGVFVNEKREEILKLNSLLNFDFIQLHGQESSDDAAFYKSHDLRVIKAFGVDQKLDFKKLKAYENSVDFFLFDYKSADHGGSGKKFEWSILDQYKATIPFLLSGGIVPEDHPRLTHPASAGLDLNSGFETKPGIKKISDIQDFIKKIRHEA